VKIIHLDQIRVRILADCGPEFREQHAVRDSCLPNDATCLVPERDHVPEAAEGNGPRAALHEGIARETEALQLGDLVGSEELLVGRV
jgi:hypothetical protein